MLDLKFVRMRTIIFLILLLFLTASSVDDAREANEAFENGNYQQAVELYRQAIEQDPENAKLHFNLASALHKVGKTEEAMQAYDRFESLSESPEEQSFASYNKGTMLTEEEKYEEAVEYFRDALRKNPNDPDARHNYELALQKQQQQEQEQQQNQDSGQNDQQENQDQQQQQDGNNNQQEDQNQDQQQPQGGQQDQEQQENEERQPQPQPTEMTPEEAQNILDALKQLERQLLENMKKESSETPSTNEKDW